MDRRRESGSKCTTTPRVSADLVDQRTVPEDASPNIAADLSHLRRLWVTAFLAGVVTALTVLQSRQPGITRLRVARLQYADDLAELDIWASRSGFE